MTDAPTLEQRVAEAMVRELERMEQTRDVDFLDRVDPEFDPLVIQIDAACMSVLPLACAAIAAAGPTPRELELLRELREIDARPNPGREPYAHSEYEIDRNKDRQRVLAALAALEEDKG